MNGYITIPLYRKTTCCCSPWHILGCFFGYRHENFRGIDRRWGITTVLPSLSRWPSCVHGWLWMLISPKFPEVLMEDRIEYVRMCQFLREILREIWRNLVQTHGLEETWRSKYCCDRLIWTFAVRVQLDAMIWDTWEYNMWCNELAIYKSTPVHSTYAMKEAMTKNREHLDHKTPVISWFINPINHSYKYHKPYINHSYWSYKPTEHYRTGASHCRHGTEESKQQFLHFTFKVPPSFLFVGIFKP